jgi:hypothetical protein
LREGCSIRNEQSEKRETNCATHASPPRVLLTAVWHWTQLSASRER